MNVKNEDRKVEKFASITNRPELINRIRFTLQKRTNEKKVGNNSSYQLPSQLYAQQEAVLSHQLKNFLLLTR